MFITLALLQKLILDALLKPVDLAVVTPDALQLFQQRQKVILSDVSHLVLDEADTLFDRSFKNATLSIIKAIRLRHHKLPLPLARADGAQVTLVGATLTNDLLEEVASLIPVSY